MWGEIFFARKFDNNVDNDYGMTMMLLLMGSRGGAVTHDNQMMRVCVVHQFNNNDANLGRKSLLDRPSHTQKRITPSIASRCRLLTVVLAGSQLLVLTYAN